MPLRGLTAFLAAAAALLPPALTSITFSPERPAINSSSTSLQQPYISAFSSARNQIIIAHLFYDGSSTTFLTAHSPSSAAEVWRQAVAPQPVNTYSLGLGRGLSVTPSGAIRVLAPGDDGSNNARPVFTAFATLAKDGLSVASRAAAGDGGKVWVLADFCDKTFTLSDGSVAALVVDTALITNTGDSGPVYVLPSGKEVEGARGQGGFFAENAVELHTSGVLVGVRSAIGFNGVRPPSTDIATVDVFTGQVKSFVFSESGLRQDAKLAVDEESGEVYVYGPVYSEQFFQYPEQKKVFKINAALDAVVWEQTYEVEQVGEIDFKAGVVGMSVERMAFLPEEGRLVLVGKAAYPFRLGRADDGGDAPMQPSSTLYRVGGGSDERIVVQPSPEKRDVAFRGGRSNDIGMFVIDGEDGRLVAARRFGSGYPNDEVVGVHGVGNGVLAFPGQYGKFPGGSSLALDKTDEGGFVGGNEGRECYN